jgi:ABC-type nitrate/sulfonate/bicarbonate transport system substrate-binding protein
MFRREFTLAAACLTAGAAAGCRRPKPAGAPKKIRVAVGRYLAMSGFYLAHEQGYFPAAGLDIEITEVQQIVETIALLADGKLDVGFVSASPSLVNAVAKAARVRIVAGREFASPTCGEILGLYVRQSLIAGPPGNLSFLRRKKIAMPQKGVLSEFSLDMALEKAGLRPEDVEIVNIPRHDAAVALAAGRVDGMVTSSDLAGGMKSPGVVVLSTLGKTLPGFQYAFVLYGRDMLAGDEETGVRFLRAYLRGTREFAAGATPEFLYKFARMTNLDPEALRGQCRETSDVDGSVKLESIERFIDWAVRKGYCEKPIAAASLVETRYINEIRRREGR